MPRTPGRALAFLLGLGLALWLLVPFWGVAPAHAEADREQFSGLEAHLYQAVNTTRESHHLVTLDRDGVTGWR